MTKYYCFYFDSFFIVSVTQHLFLCHLVGTSVICGLISSSLYFCDIDIYNLLVVYFQEEQACTKEEYAVAKHLRFNTPAHTGRLAGMTVKCFIGKTLKCSLSDLFASLSLVNGPFSIRSKYRFEIPFKSPKNYIKLFKKVIIIYRFWSRNCNEMNIQWNRTRPDQKKSLDLTGLRIRRVFTYLYAWRWKSVKEEN